VNGLALAGRRAAMNIAIFSAYLIVIGAIDLFSSSIISKMAEQVSDAPNRSFTPENWKTAGWLGSYNAFQGLAIRDEYGRLYPDSPLLTRHRSWRIAYWAIFLTFMGMLIVS
jgi:hypothetical protein